jgi:hypothetical protein
MNPAAAMEGEHTTHAAPTHTTTKCTTVESATDTTGGHTTTVRAHATTARAHTTTVPAHTASVSTTVSATTAVSATTTAATGRCNSWGKGDRCADYGGDGNGHEGLSEHGSSLHAVAPRQVSALALPDRPDLSNGTLRVPERLITLD